MKETAVLGVVAKEKMSLIEKVGRYYLHDRTFDRPYPAVDFLERAPRMKSLLHSEQPIRPNIGPLRYVFARPVPPRPVLGDFHMNVFPVVSDKIKNAIQPLVSHCAEFVPAEIVVSGKMHPYWILHHLQHIEALDEERSDFALLESGNYWYIDELFLDYAKIAEVPLERRMVFKLARSADKYFWHESVKQAVEDTEPTGIGFTFSQAYEQDGVYFPQMK